MTQPKKNVPLKIPYYMWDLSVGEGGAPILISEYDGRIVILSLDDEGWKIRDTVLCSSLQITIPDPIYIDVDNSIDTTSLEIFVLVVPTGITDSQLLAQLAAMNA